MAKKNEHWDFRFDIGDLLQRAKNSLDSDLSSFAAHSSLAGGLSGTDVEGEIPRKDMFLNFGDGPSNEDRNDFALHASRYSVLGMVTAFEVYLERLYFIALLVDHALDQSQAISGEAFHKYRTQAQNAARSHNPPQMLVLVRESLGETEGIKCEAWINSIYAARKVLSHRGSVVGDVDVNENGELPLVWQTVEVGENREGNTELRFIDSNRILKEGDALEITPEECQEIAWSFGSCADYLTQIFIDRTEPLITQKNKDSA